ncbi:flagellar hook-length control protein FliK [Vibrio renipiscarius]|uniref:Flagellar hook-length control protein-like C-terminal domain-containing protein n=1 Tax=Vibrio renipiscarius TaxID=1461322 RepID=A0A0C2NLX9_9VIBR|nr:flagellar hook-length control protein FliK [Vibrio renipiscarius]KII77305.1 hypothetical protein PL18_16670 [Vibrio renipiscarius]KII78506.1 hypothetical protein OJ16_10115 [Vibrio renipiscarius]
MNVNLSSSTEVSKVSKGSIEGQNAAIEASEDDGFFAKLTAFIQGEQDTETVLNDTSTQEAKSALAEASAEQSDVVELSDDHGAEVLLDGERVEGHQAPLAENQLEDAGAHELSGGVNAQQALQEQPNEKSAQVEQSMAENEQFLGRLDQSVKSLQTKNGNDLPLQDTAMLAAEGKTSSPLMSVQAEAESSNAMSSTIMPSELADASLSMNVDPLSDEVSDPQTVLNANGELTGLVSASADSQAQPLVETERVASMASDESVIATKETPEETAIAWGSQTNVVTDAAKPIKEELVLKGGGASTSAIATALGQAQSAAPNAASASQVASHANATNSAPLIPADAMNLSASQLLQTVPPSVSPSVTSAVQAEQMMQAAMGLKGVAAAGSLSPADGQQPVGIEAALAQQLGQATGVNNVIRPEQIAQQPALPLNREMASEQVAERVQMMLSKNLKNIDIRLDPPELGRMQIRMNMNGDNTSVHFTVANSQAREIVEQAMPRLREMLAQQGVQLADTSVQQQASGQQQNRYAASNESGSGRGNDESSPTGEENLEPDVKLDLNVASKRDGISYYA